MTPLAECDRVGRAFDGAGDYARHAGVQRRVAADLAQRLAALPLPAHPRILEIGCGTGFLTREAMDRGVGGDWTITDKAPSMVERCRDAVGPAEGRRFLVCDGEYGLDRHRDRYDLICSSMAMQWFDDLPGAVARLRGLLAPGGHLVFNTLASGTFAEWRAAHRAAGARPGVVDFPVVAELRGLLAPFDPSGLTVEDYVEHHENARDFLLRLKYIGAATARPEHRPLAPGALRKVMARFDRLGARATYEVVTCHIERRGQA